MPQGKSLIEGQEEERQEKGKGKMGREEEGTGRGHIWGHHLSPQCGKPVEPLDCPGTGANEFPLSDLTQLELYFFYL